MANLITLARLLLLFVLLAMMYFAPPTWQLLDLPLLLVVVLFDWLDGVVARRRKESTLFGAVFDIAVDRIVESVMWVALAHLGLVPVWVPIYFIVRGQLTDSIRQIGASEGQAPYEMMRTRLGRALVVGKFMRGMSCGSKLAAFGWAVLMQPLPAVDPGFWAAWGGLFATVLTVLVWLAVVVNFLRGIPVLAEFFHREDPFAALRRAPGAAE
ncbi:MAG: CDP-alcohol phosphatidyltransferase family protein [Rhodospirillales bacterium]|nr:MAG: CDP-alcohol phosphatidyltransferase family protein [Rhodospirillales bacterium]